MAADKLNPDTPNNDIGAITVKSRRVPAYNVNLGEMAVHITSIVQGLLVLRNNRTNTNNIVSIESGQTIWIAFDEVLFSGLVDGVNEFSSILAPQQNLFWGSNAQKVG